MSTDNHHPARRQALPLIAGLLCSALLAIVAVRCSSARYQTPSEATSAASQGDESNPRAPATPTTDAPPSSAAAVEAPAAAAEPTTIGRLMRATDEHDRSMLAEIERTTHQAPSASVLELLELRRAGKSRAQLESFIQTKLDGGIPARLAAMKWLRATHGEPEPADNNEVMHAPGAPDELPRTVKPLTKKNP